MKKQEQEKIETAVCYYRVSTDNQVLDGHGLDSQREECFKYCRRNGIKVIKEFSDGGKSGMNTNRDAFQEMLSYIEENPVDWVVCYKLDRLGRKFSDTVNTLEMLDRMKVGFYSVSDNLDSVSSRMLLNIMSSIAELERNQIVERMYLGKKQLVKCGGFPGGRAPYGYYFDDAGNLTINEEEAAIVRVIFELYLANYGTNAIATELNNRGYRKKKMKGNGTEPFYPEFIRQVLRNPIYCGKISFGRRKVGKTKDGKTTVKRNSDFETFQGKHEPIISEKTWMKEEDIRLRRRTNHVRAQKEGDHVFLVSGLLRCPDCNGKMYGFTYKKKNSKGEVVEYYNYRCEHTGIKDVCSHPHQIACRKIDNELEILLSQITLADDFVDYLVEKTEESLEEENEWKENIETLKKNRDNLLKSMDGVKKKITSLDILDASYDTKFDALIATMDSLKADYSNCETSIETLELKFEKKKQMQFDREKYREQIKNFNTLYKGMSELARKRVLNAWIERIDLNSYKGKTDKDARLIKSITFKKPVRLQDGTETLVLNHEEKLSVDNGNTLKRVCVEVVKYPLLNVKNPFRNEKALFHRRKRKGTYPDIIDYVKDKHGARITLEDIADRKRFYGLTSSVNSKGNDRCSPEKAVFIDEAFRYFGII